jgi:hypothetical protein
MLSFNVDCVFHDTRIFLVGAREEYMKNYGIDETNWTEDSWNQVEEYLWIKALEYGGWEIVDVYRGGECCSKCQKDGNNNPIGFTREQVVEVINRMCKTKVIDAIKIPPPPPPPPVEVSIQNLEITNEEPVIPSEIINEEPVIPPEITNEEPVIPSE